MIEYLARLKKDEEGMFDKELSPKEVRVLCCACLSTLSAGIEPTVMVVTCARLYCDVFSHFLVQVPQFFTEKDLKAMYGVFDVNRTGSISSTQAKEGAQTDTCAAM
eukprot:SAG31_NODE_11_length_38734_cov_21.263854_31_plen_106_part_00